MMLFRTCFSRLHAGLIALLLLTPQPSHADTSPKPSTAGPRVQVLSDKLPMPGLSRDRTIRLYLPPHYDDKTRRFGVLYMHDGQNLFDDATAYAGEWGVDETIDALAKSTGLELIVVGIDNGAEKRLNELSPWPNPRFGAAEGQQYTAFIVNVLKPYIDQHYRTLPDRDHTAMMGSSMGGLLSHYAAFQYPQVFSKVGIFSPSYWFSGDVFTFTRDKTPDKPMRLYFLAGGKEGEEMVTEFRKMQTVIDAKKLDSLKTEFVIRPSGVHNELFWRSELKQAIAWLFKTDAPPVRRTKP